MSFNKVILMGNMVSNPELKTTPNGISVVSFRIAVERKFTEKGKTPQSDFIDIVAWRSTAEFVSKYFVKGSGILICGSIQSRNWEDKDGQKRTSIEVIADEVSFVGKKKTEPEDNNERNAVNSDDDLPF